MQYKMLNEVLTTFQSLATNPNKEPVEALMQTLNEMQVYGELTSKQKRVLNCLHTVIKAKERRKTKGANSAINV